MATAMTPRATSPEAVETDARTGYLKVDYAGLVGALVEAVKELADRVEAVEAGANR